MLNESFTTKELYGFLKTRLITEFLNHPLNNCNSKHKNMHTVSIRIFEGKMRVRDYSINNYKAVYNEETKEIEFQILHNGLINNWVHFKDDVVLHYDYDREMLLIHVKGHVYYRDNSRRYDFFIQYDQELHELKINSDKRYQERTCKNRKKELELKQTYKNTKNVQIQLNRYNQPKFSLKKPNE